jgi:3'(2'), 5'-bisphosphate nucleotidase
MLEVVKRARLLEPMLRVVMAQVIKLRNSINFEIIIKEDGSPVTNADLWANEFILQEMSRIFPGELLIGEENEQKVVPRDLELVWFFDPIDGTKNFINRSNPFHILIGLCSYGEPILGLCAYPLSGDIIVGGQSYSAEVWHADGSKTSLNSASSYTSGSLKITLKGFDEVHRNLVYNHPSFQKAKPVLGHPSMMGPIFGFSDAYIDHRTIHYWDLCAPAAIMRSLGYQVGRNLDNTNKMNDGTLNTARFFCFPPGTPMDLKQFVYHM